MQLKKEPSVNMIQHLQTQDIHTHCFCSPQEENNIAPRSRVVCFFLQEFLDLAELRLTLQTRGPGCSLVPCIPCRYIMNNLNQLNRDVSISILNSRFNLVLI